MHKEKTLIEKIIFIDNLIDSTFSKKTYLFYRDIIDEYEHQEKEIERLNNIIKDINKILNDDDLCHIEKLQKIHKLLGSDKE